MTGTFSLISSSNKSSIPSSEISRWVDSNHQPRNFKFPCSAVGIHRVKATSLSLFLEGLLANLYFVSKGVDAQAKNLKTSFGLVCSRTHKSRGYMSSRHFNLESNEIHLSSTPLRGATVAVSVLGKLNIPLLLDPRFFVPMGWLALGVWPYCQTSLFHYTTAL